MARDGSGNYSRVEGPYVNGAIADADEINDELDDIGSALTTSINTSGTKAFAANQPMGGFVLTGLGAGTTNGHSVRYEQLTGLSATYQPLDALLTAIAALTTADDRMLDFTGVDTVAVVTYATVFTNLGVQTAGDARYAQLAAANVFTGNQKISKTTPILEFDGGANSAYFYEAGGAFILQYNATNVISTTDTVFNVQTADCRIAAAPASLATNSAGFRGLPQNIQNASYTFVLADAGKNVHAYSATCNYTIPPNSDVAFPIGTVIVVHSTAATVSVLQGSGVTLVKADRSAYTTGTRTVGNYSVASLLKADTNTWYITGGFT